MTKTEILNLFTNCVFDGILSYSDIENKILDHLPEDFSYDYESGASKLVIIPDDENFVIKIPFNGIWYDKFPDNPELKFFVHFVDGGKAKEDSWDYCLKEIALLHFAKKYKLDNCFCKECLIGHVNNYPIYIQEKATMYYELETYDFINNTEESEKSSFRNEEKFKNFKYDTVYWQNDAIQYYGEKVFNKLKRFIKNNNIDDLYARNLGYIKDKPVIVDFSGFNA